MKLGISLYPGLDADREKSLLLLQKAAALGYSRVSFLPCTFRKAMPLPCVKTPCIFLPVRRVWDWM